MHMYALLSFLFTCIFPLFYIIFFPSPPKWSRRLCSARGRAIGTNIATPEVQANVLHLRILNRRQGKVPLGCPGNHASQHALCEWQEEGVTEWELCVNGHLAGWTSSKAFFYSSAEAKCTTVHPSCFHSLQNNIIIINRSLCFLCRCSVQAEWKDLNIRCNHRSPPMFKF